MSGPESPQEVSSTTGLTEINSSGLYNGTIDTLLRGCVNSREWCLHPDVVVQMWERFGDSQVDKWQVNALLVVIFILVAAEKIP